MQHRQKDVAVLLESVHKAHNVSAIMRTCDAVGVSQLAWVAHADENFPTSGHVAAGSNRWIETHDFEKTDAAIEHMKVQDMTVYCAHFDDNAIPYREADYTKPCCIMMGAERIGVSQHAASLCDQSIIIPMHGMVGSLNVSVACALILYEMERQRTAAGMYVPQAFDVNDKQLFEWLYPKVARRCRGKQLPYPPLDELGEIITK